MGRVGRTEWEGLGGLLSWKGWGNSQVGLVGRTVSLSAECLVQLEVVTKTKKWPFRKQRQLKMAQIL